MPIAIEGALTFNDIATEQKIAMTTDIVNALGQENTLLSDIMFIPTNKDTSHRVRSQTSIPKIYWHTVGRGVKPSKSHSTTFEETTAMLEGRLETDPEEKQLLAPGAYEEDLTNQTMAFGESFRQKMATAFFYGNIAASPEGIHGLAPRYDDLTGPATQQIIDAGGTGNDNASIWMVNWHPLSCVGLYPRNVTPGFQMKYRPDVQDKDDDGYEIFKDLYQFKWPLGMAVPDKRGVARLCNIDRSLLSSDASTGANLPELLFRLITRGSKVEALGKRQVMYLDSNTLEAFQQQLSSATKESSLTIEMVGGVRVYTYQGIPLRINDALNTNEARVV